MTVDNKNMLSPVGFQLAIQRSPHINFFVQGITVPSLGLGVMEQQTPVFTIPQPGDRVTYSELQVSFRVDEDLNNYLDIFNWIKALGFPESPEQYAELEKQPQWSGEGLVSDGTVLILSSAMNANVEFTFTDMWPTSLSGFEMNSRDTSVEYVECTVDFKFTSMKVRKIVDV